MATATAKKMKVTAFYPWYGSNRTLAAYVGAELDGCEWVGVPFAGGMCELAHIGARTLQVNDLHRHAINAADVAKHPVLGPKMYRTLRRTVFHPDTLRDAQRRCLLREQHAGDADSLFAAGLPDPRFERGPDLEWAVDYFVVAWMTRHATAGTPAEFTGGTSARWGATGGDSAAHFHGAVRELPAWRRVFRRCNFTTLDAFEFLDEVFAAEQRDWGKPQQNHTQRGIYADPPFPGPGDRYTHAFGEAGQRRLATSVRRFRFTRCVLRFYDHPLVRELYPEGPWTWVRREGKRQTNDVGPEVLLINGRSITAAAAIRGEL
jgi:DNA adenine methylase